MFSWLASPARSVHSPPLEHEHIISRLGSPRSVQAILFCLAIGVIKPRRMRTADLHFSADQGPHLQIRARRFAPECTSHCTSSVLARRGFEGARNLPAGKRRQGSTMSTLACRLREDSETLLNAQWYETNVACTLCRTRSLTLVFNGKRPRVLACRLITRSRPLRRRLSWLEQSLLDAMAAWVLIQHFLEMPSAIVIL